MAVLDTLLGDGPIIFNEMSIKNIAELLDIINHHVARHGLAVIDCRKGATQQRIDRL